MLILKTKISLSPTTFINKCTRLTYMQTNWKHSYRNQLRNTSNSIQTLSNPFA